MQERTWIIQERRPTMSGPWTDEPDKAQWPDNTTGLPCLALRNHMGVWCGYVGVTSDHPWYEKSYTDVEDLMDIDVHGGLTFSGACREANPDGICHIPDPHEDAHVWWFGFDCAHNTDFVPNSIWKDSEYDRYRTYRTFTYVQKQCSNLAVQLIKVRITA